MFPDTVPSPKAAEAFEAELRLLDLPEVPGSLDARMQELLAKPPVAAGIPKRRFLNKELPWIVAVSGLAACAVLVVRMAPQPASAPAKSIAAATPNNPPEITPPPVRHMEAPVLDCAIPVGYQYQGSRALYAEETPVGTVRQPDGTPMRAWQRKSMLRHTYTNPATHATFEVDVPRETVVLEDLPKLLTAAPQRIRTLVRTLVLAPPFPPLSKENPMRFLSLALLGALAGAPLAWAENSAKCPACAPGHEAAQAGMVDAAFLGVASEPISLERAGDLQLPPGTGLSVLMIAPDSPASKAGLQAGDVLTKLDDQLLINPSQLRVLVRLHKEGEPVTFQIVRQGKAQTVKATLGTRKMPELTPGGEERRMLLPPGGAGQFNIPGNLQIMPLGDGKIPPEMLNQLPKEFRERMQGQLRAQAKALGAGKEGAKALNDAIAEALVDGAPGEVPGGLNFSSRIVSSDGSHTITVQHSQGNQHGHLSITDKDGVGVYDGDVPANDKEWEKVPQDVRAKAKAMCGDGGVIRVIPLKKGADPAKAKEPEELKDAKPGQSF